ncbi:MAG: AAA family ATPase [Desulfobulbaceae bacterium]|nr:AAA family ATPase [Desulfobulbaceae bacterium]
MQEKIRGIVERVTYHNDTSGWSVLKVTPFQGYGELVTVTVHQTRVFAGSTMEFIGNWAHHAKFGKQFKARFATELKPATAGALEKYLGSGLIKGVGPATAKRIVRHFGDRTMNVFEEDIAQLTKVPGIAEKKLAVIKEAWIEHRAIRDVMIFLQSHGISTLFAVRIYKQYGDHSIERVQENPYRLAVDFYGIGFFTADRVALSLGFAPESDLRIRAAIRHVLSASREMGHCYLSRVQISTQVEELLKLRLNEALPGHLEVMQQEGQLRVRVLPDGKTADPTPCYYAKSLYYEEEYVAKRLASMVGGRGMDPSRISDWMHRYTERQGMALSVEQAAAVCAVVDQQCAILTGGPGCGKTTTTKVIVALLEALNLSVLLTAPTGRAAQRMGEVIGLPAKTIHRLLEFQGTGFKRCEENPLQADFLIIDETSMLDISLTASLLKAVAPETAILFIGDADQLPSVGAGNVLRDLIACGAIPCYRLTTIFRQAQQSAIISAAHQINRGEVPSLDSPFKTPELWKQSDCFFIDSAEATQQQLQFVNRVKLHYTGIEAREDLFAQTPYDPVLPEENAPASYDFRVPEQFSHVSLGTLATAEGAARELLALAKKTHPWSSLYYGLTAVDVVRKLYQEWIPKYLGAGVEIQVLTPMIRGTLGAANLNKMLQQNVNPPGGDKAELSVGDRIFRTGDRVIHRRNNYELNVFNGDIGLIDAIDNVNLTCEVAFFPDRRRVEYNRDQITELDLAYAITVHKSQGSEFDVVIIPVLTQHFRMLFRNLIYTGLTRGKRLAILVGSRQALAMAVRNRDTSKRQTALALLIPEFRAALERG